MKNLSKKPEIIQNLFNSISKDYDKLNDILTFKLHKLIKKDIVYRLNLQKDSNALDLCTGTGDMVGYLRRKYPDVEITAVDFSEKMLEIARFKHPSVKFLSADCTNLPFENEQFDLCVISFGLRNTEDINQALKEIYRVLKKGGTFVNLDLGKPHGPLNIFAKPFLYAWSSFVGKTFHGEGTPYEYLAESNEYFPSQMELVKIYKEIGFSNIKNTDYLLGQLASQTATK